MPGKIKVKVLAGRNLPVMDRASDTTDAFVEIKFGGVTHKTDVCRKSLNPHWNSTEWYRFEVDESELQDEPLQLRLMDHDTYSANDAIGKVVISLAPLLAREANNAKGNAPHGGAVMSGWIPVFDTMHGIRGELNVIVKVELFSDFNKYKTSSCGVQFFHCPTIPPGYRTTSIHGFVEELVVNDDPEYQWIDKIRTPRASNEARQVAFIKLSNQVQRLVGLKAAELGANAVVGYQQDFDLEGEAGVVARAIGTAVTISPLPTPSQPMNMPPCTQQQLKKYLDILSTDNENVTDLNEYYQHHQDELAKLLTILNPKTPSLLDETDINDDNDDEKLFNNLTRQSSVKSYTGNISIYQDDYISQKSLKHISEDQTDLNRLLNRDYFDSDTPGPLRKIKKFKSNFFLKRLSSMRGRKQETQDDQISLKSNSSDTSRISLVDIKNELKKFKRIKKPKFHKIANNADEGIGMASVLARSVIHAHTSLACIAETQDSEHSPNSTLRRASESEPTINMSDEDKPKTTDTDTSFDANSNKDENKQVPEIHFSSLMNINSDENEKSERRERRFSESCPTSPVAGRNNNLLKPEDADYYGSVSSALSGDSSEIYSSSDEDDESSDVRTDTEKSVETTSSIVKSVLSHEINPAFIAQMDRKLSILETENLDRRFVVEEKQKKITNADTYESDNTINEKKEKIVEKQHNATMFAHEDANTFVTPKSNTHHYKFHNPFTHKKVSKSFSAPSSPIENSSFVYRSSQKIKQQLSKLSNSNMIKSLSHYSLIPKKKHEEVKKMSKPNSATDILSRVPSETVLGSPFLSYADLLSLDKEEMVANKNLHKSDEFVGPKVSMYIGSEPVSRASMSGTFYTHHGSQDIRNHEHVVKVDKRSIKPSSLVHTAMETILIDKVQSLLTPSSPEPIPVTKQFFNDVSEKLEKIEEARNQTPETTGLVHTAVETMLLDKVQSLLGPTTPEPSSQKDNVKSYFDNVKPDVVELNKREQESTGLTSTAMKTMLMDKVQTLVSPKTEFQPENLLHDTDNSNKTCSRIRDVHESSGLTHTAMKTILADKVNSLLGSSKVDIVPNTQDMKSERKNGSRNKDQHSSGLVHTAMETILMDKVQSILDTSSTEVNSSKEVHEISNAVIKKDIVIPHEEEVQSSEKSKSLDSTKTALLVERVVEQPLFIPTSHVSQSGDDITTETKPDDTELKKKKKLIRQDTVDFVNEKQLHKMSKLANTIPRKVTTPVLQHFHPILSGAPLETIPSLPESSFDQSESIDENIPKCQCESECKCQECESSDTNNASVCDNSHAAWTVDRGERDKDRSEKDKGSPRHARHESYGGKEPVPPVSNTQNSSLHSTSTPMGIHRRSSDSDLSITPKGSSVNTPGVNVGSGGGAILKPSMNSNNLEMLEYPFLTMSEYPPGFIVHIGGTVCARSVKLVDGGGESAARAAWWAELRTELRAHARALRCNAVLAYSDTAAICEDVCVLSASGTAAVINLDCDFNADCEPITGSTNTKIVDETEECCSIAHVPYSPGAGPYRAELSVCGGCRRARVPAVVLASCAKPARLAASPRAITLTAVAARVRRTPPTGEPAARDISDQLPFLEYELHKLLIAKLRMQGANALFSLQTQVCVGERCVMALASGAAVRLAALPPPTPPRIKSSENDKDALEIQKALWDTFAANKAANGFDIGGSELSANGALPEVEGDESTAPALDLCSDKDACVLELDEAEDVETARSLATRRLHTRLPLYGAGLQARSVPPHAFTQVWRARLQLGAQGGGASAAAERHVARALDGVAYKLRRLQPCAALAPRLQLDLPEDEIQLVVSGAAIPLVDPTKPDINQTENSHMQNSNQGHSNQSGGTGDADDDIFALDEEQLVKTQQTAEVLDEKAVINAQAVQAVQPAAVVLTALNSVQGARGARRLCALRLLFVRETTCVRELGGLSGFLHTFTCEVLAIVRAYTAALGGNALTSFYITQLMLQDNAHKNQGQCLLSVGGDVVHITY